MGIIEFVVGAAVGVGGMAVKDRLLGSKASDELSKAKREMDSLSDEVERLKKRLRESEDRVEELLSENRHLQMKNKEKSSSYDDIEDERDLLTGKVKKLQVSNAELECKLREYMTACEALQNEINTLKQN